MEDREDIGPLSPLPYLDSVEAIEELIMARRERCLYIRATIEMCLLSIVPFDQGWYLLLMNKDATRYDRARISDTIARRELFCLRIWHGDGDYNHVRFTPGSLVYVRRVTNFILIGHMAYADGNYHDVF